MKSIYSGPSLLKNLGPVPVQISEIFRLVNAYCLNGVLFSFYLIHLRIAMNIIKMGVWIGEGRGLD